MERAWPRDVTSVDLKQFQFELQFYRLSKGNSGQMIMKGGPEEGERLRSGSLGDGGGGARATRFGDVFASSTHDHLYL